MKFAQALFSALVGGFVLSLATGAHAQSTTNSYATVVRIQGEARYSTGNNEWHPLTVGQALGRGDVIQSSVNGKVDLFSAIKSPTGSCPPRTKWRRRTTPMFAR